MIQTVQHCLYKKNVRHNLHYTSIKVHIEYFLLKNYFHYYHHKHCAMCYYSITIINININNNNNNIIIIVIIMCIHNSEHNKIMWQKLLFTKHLKKSMGIYLGGPILFLDY